MMRFAKPLLAAVAAVAAAASCGDPMGLEATDPTVATSLGLFAFSKAPPTYPAAINTPFAVATTVDANANFDIAFDIDSQGRVVLYPPRTLVTPLLGSNSVGLQKVAGTYESVERAPTSGYVRDSSLVIAAGDVVVVEARRVRSGDYCSFALSPSIYSKLVVDSSDATAGTIALRLTVDPNCGFRSFLEGIPKN